MYGYPDRYVPRDPQPAPDRSPRHTVGISVGTPSDSTGLVAIESTRADDPPRHAVRHLARFPPGTAYSEIVLEVGRVLAVLSEPSAVVDCTAVGADIASRFEWSNTSVRKVILTAGEAAGNRVPRLDVAAKLLLALQDSRLTIAKGKLADALAKDLRTFSPRPPTGAASELAWRDQPSDDLVLALAVALLEADCAPFYARAIRIRRPRLGAF